MTGAWLMAMPAIDSLMKRLGFVKLSQFGLVLTPEDRILSLRPAALDDGLGGRIVGWQDGDLAAMELEKWEPARPRPAVVAPTRILRPAVPKPRVPMPQDPVRPVTAATVAPTIVHAPNVAAAPIVEEDDWEWTIAIAHARTAPEESESEPADDAAAAQAAVAGDQTQTQVTKVDADGWPKTDPLSAHDYDDPTDPRTEIVRVVRRAAAPRVVLAAKATQAAAATPAAKATPAATAMPVAKATPVAISTPATKATPAVDPPVFRPLPDASSSPATIIPVPSLPTLKTSRATRIEPVVRARPTAMSPTPPRRFAEGTRPQALETLPYGRAVESDPGFAQPAVGDVAPPAITHATKG